jgi:hypothetical protein
MNRLAAIWIGAHARLLRLYPKAYRDEFGEERQAVFNWATRDAAQRGARVLLRLGLRELRDLPGAVVRAHIYERGKKMAETSTPDPVGADSSWKVGVVAVLPFAVWLLPSLFALLNVPLPIRTAWVSISQWFYRLLPLIGIIAGWSKGFPRWSFPYVGLGILSIGVPPALRLVAVVHSEPILLAGVLAAAGIVVLIARVWRPLRRLDENIRRDWTQLTFGLFTALLLAQSLIYDPVPFDYQVPFEFTSSLIVVAGALLYWRSRTKSARVASLFIPAALALSVATASRIGYFGFKYGWGEIFFLSQVWLGSAILLAAPALLGFRFRAARPASSN